MSDGAVNKLYSFSGADTDVWAWFPGFGGLITPLQTCQTISVSVHEAKGQVRRLGQRGISGLTRSVRTIAGSMIFVIVNDHPLRNLQRLAFLLDERGAPYGWSLDYRDTGTGVAENYNGDGNIRFVNRLGTLLRPFNVLMRHVTEYPTNIRYESGIGQIGDSAAELLIGVEFIDEGKVTSVNDIYTEITYSYIAKDYKPLSSTYVNLSNDEIIAAAIQEIDQVGNENDMSEYLAAMRYLRNPATPF